VGFLDTQSNANNVEALYVAYFGRAGDGPGYLYWNNQLATEEAAGTPISSAVVNVSDAFAVQPEATAAYSFLASPPPTLSATDPVQIAGVDAFINQVYQDLFNRQADTVGEAYWQNQILTGAVSVGSAVYAIANGALGGDQTVLAEKITAASYFTTQTYGANLVSGATFLAVARAAIAPVVDSTTEQASVAATNQYVSAATTAASTSTFTLTTGADNIAATGGNNTILAPLVGGQATFGSGDTITGGGSNDTLTITGVGGTLQAASLTGIANVNLDATALAATGDGFNGTTVSLLGDTGIAKVASTGSAQNAAFINIGSGSVTAEVDNSVNGASFIYTNAALAGGTDTVNLNLNNAFGPVVIAPTDGATGAGTVAIHSNTAPSDISLSEGTATSLATITVDGSQDLTLAIIAPTPPPTGAPLPTVTDLDAHTFTGDLNYTAALPAGAATILGGSGNDTINITSGFTNADSVDGGTGTNTLGLASADATSYVAPVTPTVSNFQSLTILDSLTGSLTPATIEAGLANNLTLLGGTGGPATVTGGSGAFAITLGRVGDVLPVLGPAPGALRGTLTVNDTGTATTDTLTITNPNRDLNVGNGQSLDVNGYGTVTVSNTGLGAPATQTFDAITLTPNAGGTGALVFTGADSVTTGVITATTVSASGLTGLASFRNTGAVGVTSITGTTNGNDIIVGSATTGTTITDGNGNDTITAGSAGDSITAGNGNDIINGGGGNDTITAGSGNDLITETGPGTFSIVTGSGTNTVHLSAALIAGDTVTGGGGNDTLILDATAVTAAAGAGVTGFKVLSTTASQNLANFANNTTFTEVDTSGNAAIANAGSGVATLGLTSGTVSFGRAGGGTTGSLTVKELGAPNPVAAYSVTLTANNEANLTFNTGTTGNLLPLDVTLTDAALTTLTVTGAGAFTVTTAAGTNPATVNTSAVTGDVDLDLRNDTANATITAGGGEDTIRAGSGNDSITAGSGNDLITSAGGNDTITAGDGNDTINGGGGNNTITVGGGDDAITSGSGNDTITAGDGNDSITGGGGFDNISAGNGHNTNTDAAGTFSIVTGSGTNNVILTAALIAGDTVTGGTGNNTLTLSATTATAAGSGVTGFKVLSTSASQNLANFANNAFTEVDVTGSTPVSITNAGSSVGTLGLGAGSAVTFARASAAPLTVKGLSASPTLTVASSLTDNTDTSLTFNTGTTAAPTPLEITSVTATALTAAAVTGTGPLGIGTLTDNATSLTLTGTSTPNSLTVDTLTDVTLGSLTLGNNVGIGAFTTNVATGVTIAGGSDNSTVVATLFNGASGAGVTDTVTLGDGAGDNVTDNAAALATVNITTGNGDGDTVTTLNSNGTIAVGSGAGDSVGVGDGNNTITVGNGAGDSVVVGNGTNTITVGNGAGDTIDFGSGGNTITAGAGNDIFTLTAANTLSTVFGTIGGAHGGDTLKFVNGAGAVGTTITAIANQGTTAGFSDYVTAALAVTGGAAVGDLATFQFGGNTYLLDHGVAGTTYAAGDSIIGLSGLHTLGNSTWSQTAVANSGTLVLGSTFA
jgi:hypothetical protein